jgi:Na+/H+ antiporter NhaD/arsenite permease-like protein
MDDFGDSDTHIVSPLNFVIVLIINFSFNDFLIKRSPVAISALIFILFYFKKYIKIDEKLLSNIEKLFEMDGNKP